MRGGLQKTISGEVGILRYIHSSGSPSHKCYLVIEYEAEHYVGTVFFDDRTFRDQMIALILQNIGRPIKEIGDLDVSFAL
jgi:hypothetical protein